MRLLPYIVYYNTALPSGEECGAVFVGVSKSIRAAVFNRGCSTAAA